MGTSESGGFMCDEKLGHKAINRFDVTDTKRASPNCTDPVSF